MALSDTGIGWTDMTWNFVTGCDKVTDGCTNCYALNLAPRLKAMGSKRYQNDGDPRTSGPGFDVTIHEDLLNQPKSVKTPKMIFVNSMSDLFHARVPIEIVERAFETMRATPWHTYQVLTKRASRLPRLADRLDWPENLWMGVTVENEAAMSRIEDLKAVPTPVRFISAEPLLGPLPGLATRLDGIAQVIVGGESGKDFRPIEADWAREVRDACTATGTSFFFKQWGGLKPKSGGKELDGREWCEIPERATA